MNHHAVLLNHSPRQTKAVLLPLVVVLGNGGETENMRNMKLVLLNCFGMVEGYEEILELQAIFGLCLRPGLSYLIPGTLG